MRTKLIALALLAGALAPHALSHCDTLDGPVAADARAALEKGDVTAVLKWVRADDEAAIREAFATTIKVRALGAEARDLADTSFLETVVRIHRQSEGEPYTGLKPAGTADPAFLAADRALEAGSVDKVADEIGKHVALGIRSRFEHARAARLHADESVEAGRAYVAAYVDYIHYVEALHAAGKHAAHARHE
ncbi:MAG: DUF6448 family protein [Planctomycetes bacterium]|nr:DUF6448 family protein [Planctomycetota bacterium]